MIVTVQGKTNERNDRNDSIDSSEGCKRNEYRNRSKQPLMLL